MPTRSVRSVQKANACSTMGRKAVQGVRETNQACGTSMVVTVQRERKSQLLPSKRCTAAVGDTISKAWLQVKARRGTRARAAQNSGVDNG